MAGDDRTQTMAFLYKIIDDNQATIRFLDTKCPASTVLSGQRQLFFPKYCNQ